MIRRTTNHGGYYALKGFMYQIHKLILEILDNPKKAVSFERDQDIDYDDVVIQVKHHESTKYALSRVRAPIAQLLEWFESDPRKKYQLYAHFKGKTVGAQKLSLGELDKILGKNNYPVGLKKNFVSNLTIHFAEKFDEHFGIVVKRIKADFACKSDEEAIVAYGGIFDHLTRKLTENTKTKMGTSNRAELTRVVQGARKCNFYSAYREFLSDDKYFRLIKKKHFSWQNINDNERFVVIETHGNETVEQMKTAILIVMKKFYRPQKRIIKSGAPFIYMINVEADKLKRVKSLLHSEGYVMRDGYDFLDADFSTKLLKERSTKGNKIALKFLNTEDDFRRMFAEGLDKTKEVYQFFLSEPLEVGSEDKNVKIHIRDLSDVESILA